LAARELGKRGQASRNHALPALANHTDAHIEQDPAVRAAACEALGRLGVAATNMARALCDHHAAVRLAANKAVAEVASPISIDGSNSKPKEIALGVVPLKESQKGERVMETDPPITSDPHIHLHNTAENITLRVLVEPSRRPVECTVRGAITVPEAEESIRHRLDLPPSARISLDGIVPIEHPVPKSALELFHFVADQTAKESQTSQNEVGAPGKPSWNDLSKEQQQPYREASKEQTRLGEEPIYMHTLDNMTIVHIIHAEPTVATAVAFCVRDDDPEVRKAAIKALGALGPQAAEDEKALATIAQELESPDGEIRYAAAKAVALMAGPGQKSAPAVARLLTSLLSDPKRKVRNVAAKAVYTDDKRQQGSRKVCPDSRWWAGGRKAAQ